MRSHGITLVELLLAAALAGLLLVGAVRLAVASSDQQQAVLQGTNLQAELRRASGVAQQVVSERPFLLPLRGSTAGFEFLQGLPESRFRVLGVSASGLTVRFANQGYDPRNLRRALVVDAGGNGYVYTLTRVSVLDAATGTYALEGTACTVPSGQGLRGVGAVLSRIGSGAALNTFAGSGSLEGNRLFFQEENRTPELLMSIAAPQIRYIYRAASGQVLYQDTPALFQQTGGQRYDLAGLALGFEGRDGQGVKEARRTLDSDLLFQADNGLGLRRLDCSPAPEPPPIAAGDWRVEVAGLDPGVSAQVLLSGPGGYSRTLTASTTLSGLRQGTYAVAAQSVVNPGLPIVRYRPTTPPEGGNLAVEVGGATRPVTQVSYTRIPGRLRVRIEGVPAGTQATMQASGTYQTTAFSLGNGEHSLEVQPGQYTITFPSIPDARGEWVPDRSGIAVGVPSEGEGDVGIVRYRLEAAASSLLLEITYSGDTNGLTPESRVCVRREGEPECWR
ncbi:hypothetical protein [Meiothermus sp. CFH 77666]|uniref:hypothetical protein n=1 Tax=Meiothermus sp. CFH 77666 TaxID=2817942 RepID=UPI001AA06643|nr:hypothetical protein [Meiothermus sp. CFH 77666]MBO1438445.1 hypothetical protein [Meiothermus sp. CFH 77666]